MMLTGPQDWRTKLPYWTCQGQVFNTKLSALMHASKINNDIEFRFNDEFLDKLDWTKQPPLPIDEYYKQRAEQLRDTYDYILVMYSGGSDSSTIVKTFLRNNIFIDEVGIYGVWNHKINKYNSIVNLEQTHAAWPFLKKISADGTKISHINLLDSVSQSLNSQDWIYQSDLLFTAQQSCRFQSIFQREDLVRMVEQGKKVAVIIGHDKARVVVNNNAFYHGFLDVAGLGTWIYPQFYDSQYVGPSMEPFFCNADVPEIMIKQSHMIAEWYWKNFKTDSKNMLTTSYLDPKYTSRANTIMYPTTWRELDTYTLGKHFHVNVFTWAWRSEWLYEDLPDTIYYENWINGIRHAFSMIDQRFVKPNNKGLVGHWSKLRKILDFPVVDQ